MEMELTFLLLFSSLIFILIIKSKKASKEDYNRPPSPPKLPFIGHLHHLRGELPHHALRKLSKRYGPILHLQLGRITSVVISSPHVAKQLLKVQDPACADRPDTIAAKILFYNYTDVAFSPYNDYWRQMRKLCILELLSARNVRSYAFIRKDEASRLVKSIQSSASSGQVINITKLIFAFTCSIICRTAFGNEVKDRDVLVDILKNQVVLLGGFKLADLFPSLEFFTWSVYKLLRLRRKLDAILDVVIEEHKLKQRGEFGGEDIIDVMLRVQRTGEVELPITNDNIKAIIFDLFSAGSETSSTTVDWAMAELIKNPLVMAKVQAEVRQVLNGKKMVEESDIVMLKYLKMVVKETLRMHPPFPLLLRVCREECQVDGYDVPLKAKVMVNIWAIGRDPEYWDSPESFQPERFGNNSIDFLGNNFEFIPFGSGKRICPGINSGLANVELPLAQLLYHFDWSLPKGMSFKDMDMTEAEGISVARKNNLFLIPTICNPFNDE